MMTLMIIIAIGMPCLAATAVTWALVSVLKDYEDHRR